MASVSGWLGGVAGNPADVLNVRMQHDAALPPSQRRRYKNAIDGLIRMVGEEGWRSLFRGVWPNSLRAVLMTASQLASYDAFKSALLASPRLDLADDLTTHLSASFLAGFVATTICSPVDVIKTRLMSSRSTLPSTSSSSTGHQEESLYRILVRICRQERVSWVFKGWLPSFIRLAPHTVATFLFLEQHKKIFRRLKDLND